MDMEKLTAQTALFHQKTLAPSSILNGIRLRRAIHELSVAPLMMIRAKGLWRIKGYRTRNRAESITLAKGPASAMIPTIFLSASPTIMTAPGETNFIGIGATEINVMIP